MENTDELVFTADRASELKYLPIFNVNEPDRIDNRTILAALHAVTRCMNERVKSNSFAGRQLGGLHSVPFSIIVTHEGRGVCNGEVLVDTRVYAYISNVYYGLVLRGVSMTSYFDPERQFSPACHTDLRPVPDVLSPAEVEILRTSPFPPTDLTQRAMRHIQ